MGNLLSKRPGFLKFALPGVLILATGILYLLFFKPPPLDNAAVERTVLANLQSIETTLAQKVEDYKQRAGFIFNKYQSKQLPHAELGPKEALIIAPGGVITDYFGEIYYFKFKDMGVNQWLFNERKNALFFMQKMADHVFYVRYFCNLESNFILDRVKYDAAVKEITFFKEEENANNKTNAYQYDEARGMFFYSHLLKGSNNRLALYLKFSKKDIENYYRKRETLFFYAVLLGFLLTLMLAAGRKKPVLGKVLWLALLSILFVMLSRTGGSDLYLTVGNIPTFHSLARVLLILAACASLCYWDRHKMKLKWPGAAFLLFNLALLAMLKTSDAILKAVDFNHAEFDSHYLTLVLVLLLLNLFPLFFIRNISSKRNLIGVGGFLLLQAAVTAAGYYLLKINAASILVVSIIAFLAIFFEKKFLTRMAVVFLLAVSIFHLANRQSVAEKKEFIADNLKEIFLNQNNYAKFMAREIVHELNLESMNFYKFFQEDASSRLETTWRRTMASRENIASGIFVLSPDGSVLSQYAYLLQYLDVEARAVFPFWAIEDAEANLFGKKTPLAMASITVVRQGKTLGRIVVQVLNAPELILRHQDKVNIFTIDNKIDGMDLSYIKLDEQNRIVENPSNINLENVAGLLKIPPDDRGRWTSFRFIDLTFSGYIFKHEKDTIIIFFPAATLFKNFSEIIKIYLFLALLFFLFYSRDMKRLDWKSIYYSFSIRVFGILIIISLLTAVIFSLFSINFNSRSSLRQSLQMMYERGRAAQNIGYNLLAENEEFTPNHLVLLSRILNSDVSIYKKGALLETSNYRKTIDYEVPNFLHSNIVQLLTRKNQKFVLLDQEDGYHLYFQVYDYILDVEFSYQWPKLLSEKDYYTNFIITLFFILAIIGFSSAFFFRKKILAPVDDLNKGMAEVEKGGLPQLKKIPAEIELKNLYMGFNAMIEGIREQKKNISEISRMKTIIKLGRRVAHEVKNPLTPIKLSAEQILLALKDKNPDYENIIRQSINYIIDETEHLRKVSYGFLDLSRLDELSPQPFDMRDLVREEVFNAAQIYSHIDFPIHEEVDDDVDKDKNPFIVTLDKFKIKQALKNLINNSLEAIGEKNGVVAINLARRRDRISLEVVDNGVGMDEEGLNRIYNIDYSTKESGTGLGLFIVKRIIDLHKGHIVIESAKNKGARVKLELPV
ncbi:MAG: ATP-binding protein [Candidatus Aminicenantes bacterium]|nr:ATP-binding protein [Candidatus Aminicenantes bacterium]